MPAEVLLNPILSNMSMVPAGLEATIKELRRLETEVTGSAQKYFVVKGDVIVFQNTDDLAKTIHAALVKLNAAAQSAMRALNGYADDVRRMDDRALFAFAMAKFLELRVTDPSMMELLGVLAAAQTALATTELSRLVESMLRKMAKMIEDETRKLRKYAESKSTVRVGVWAGLKGNTFNWKKQQFQEAGTFNLVARFANWWKLNPMVSKAKQDVGSYFLASLFSSALSTVGLPGPAVDPTANMLAALAMEGSS